MEMKKIALVVLVLTLISAFAFASAPTYSIVDGNSNTVWRTANFNIVFADVNSLGGGGIASAQYSLNGGAYANFDSNTGTVNDYNFIKSITTDGNYKINARFTAVDGNVLDVNNVFGLLDKTAPTVSATSYSGFSRVGSNIYGTGRIVGGIAVDTNTGLKNGYSDLNTDSCQYTTDGTNWASADWNAGGFCQKASVTVNGGQSYTFGTRIKDNVGNLGTGATIGVQGAMLAGDMGNVTVSTIGEVLYGLASNSGTLIIVLVLTIAIVLAMDALTGTFGIIEKLKRMF